jgi:hypothetical protein
MLYYDGNVGLDGARVISCAGNPLRIVEIIEANALQSTSGDRETIGSDRSAIPVVNDDLNVGFL